MIICVTACIICHLIFRKVFKYRPQEKNKDILANFFAASCLLYSLLLAFVIIAVWEDYEDVNSVIIEETEKLLDIREQATELPPMIAQKINGGMILYAQHEIARMKGKEDTVARGILLRLRSKLYLLDSFSVNHKIIDNIKDDIKDIVNLRHKRDSHVNSHIPHLVWVVLITGSIVVVIFSYMFLAGTERSEYLFLTLFVGMISMCLFLVYALDHPFYGTSGVSLEPFRQLMNGGT
jgi:uncharacterized Tic20 family protein